MIISRCIFLRMRNVSHKIYEENQNTHFMFNNPPPQPCFLWNDVEPYSRTRQATDDNITRRKRFACWINKATDTHSDSVIIIVFPRNNGYADVSHCYVIHICVLICIVKHNAFLTLYKIHCISIHFFRKCILRSIKNCSVKLSYYT
jgi:hypothetical protein